MRTWAVGFILGSLLCLAAIFVWVGLQTLGRDRGNIEQQVDSGTEIAKQEIAKVATSSPEDSVSSEPVVEELTSERVEETVVAEVTPELEDSPEPTAIAEPVPEAVTEPEPTPEPSVLAEPLPAETAATSEPAVIPADPIPEPTTEPQDPAVEAPEKPALPQVSIGSDIGVGEGTSSRLPKITDEASEPKEYEIKPEPVDDGTPKLAIILVDIGDQGATVDSLVALEYPVTVAISPAREDAPARSQALNSNGKSVLALSPQDVEFSLSGNLSERQVSTLLDRYFAIMPDAIGMLDRPEATLQVDRQLARSVVKSFAKNGKNLVTYSKGLNSLLKDASNAEVPAAKIYRSLDAKGEDEAAILRTLDRAVLEATQSGQVIVQGTTSSATLAAIEKWRETSRASSVSLVPIQKVLASK